MLKSDEYRDASFACFKSIEGLERHLDFSLLTKQQQRTVQHVMDTLTDLIEELDATAEAHEADEKVGHEDHALDLDTIREARIAALRASIAKREVDIPSEMKRAESVRAAGDTVKADNISRNVFFNQRTLAQERQTLDTILRKAQAEANA